MKNLNNSIIAAVLTIGSFSITHSQETEINGGNTKTSTQSVSSEKESGSQVESSQNASNETNTQTENRGIDKKDVRRMSSANQNPLYEDKNKEGVNPLYEAQRKGINEGRLKKNDVDAFETEHSGDPHERTQGKLKGKIIKAGNNGMINVSDENQETPTARKGWDGTVKGGTAAQRKGINEKGLKKNNAEISTTNSEKKGLNAVNVKLSKSNTEQASDLIDDANSTPQGHAVKTKGSGATSGPEVKPIKVEETKIGQPHP